MAWRDNRPAGATCPAVRPRLDWAQRRSRAIEPLPLTSWLWRNPRLHPKTASSRLPPVHKADLEGCLWVESSRSLLMSGTVAPGGEHAYKCRLGKDRSPGHSRPSIASAKSPSPPKQKFKRCCRPHPTQADRSSDGDRTSQLHGRSICDLARRSFKSRSECSHRCR
jgi:hypothetical protein